MALRAVASILVLGLVLPCCGRADAQRVQDPRASLADVSARRQALKTTHDPVLLEAMHRIQSCTATPFVVPPMGRMIVPRHYLSGSSGPVNPAEAPAVKTYDDFERRVDAGMNAFLATGSHHEAACALDQLDAWAHAGELLNYDREESSQAWFQVEWTLAGIGISHSVLAQDTTLDPAEVRRVTSWLVAASHKSIGFERGPRDGNNHHYWRALHAIVIGALASDDELFQFGVSAYKDAIAEINPDGSLPREMVRHENALAYQGFALEPLIVIAQAASRQGIDLYTYAVHGRSLQDAVGFFGKALEDPKLIEPYTKEAQSQVGMENERFAAIPFYVQRFGTDGVPRVLLSSLRHPVFAPRLGGFPVLLAGGASHP